MKEKKMVYVTGCAGFIGHYVAQACLDQGWMVRGVDSLTYASDPMRLAELKRHANFKFQLSDINDLTRLYDCDYVINLAAETHVDNSIAGSDVFLKSNINGVHHLLELCRARPKPPVLLHFSTDEVYGDIDQGSHIETDPLKPSNPYAATKAAADQLILAWSRTYGVPYVIVRPTNNYGIGQYVEKFIPRAVKYLSLGKKIQLHESGTPRRTWLHAQDTAAAVIKIIEHGVINEIFNISGNFECQNIEVANKIVCTMGLPGDPCCYMDMDHRRPGQDVRYAIDDSKIKKLGWYPVREFDSELAAVVKHCQSAFTW